MNFISFGILICGLILSTTFPVTEVMQVNTTSLNQGT